MARRYESFGGASAPTPHAIGPEEAIALLKGGKAGPGSLLAYGNGRSYGDTCQNRAGVLVDMRSRNRILSFDPDTGLLKAEAGAMLADEKLREFLPAKQLAQEVADKILEFI